MYGYSRQTANGNTLMTNLNSISSSISSIDTIGRCTNNSNNNKASADNLITLRSHSIASTSLLWNKNSNKDDRYSTKNGISRHNHHHHHKHHPPPGSEIYYGSGGRNFTNYCLNPQTALHFLLVPLLLLTITRQVFDFLGQIWLQIIINFFTILLIIVALFGIKQHRISYLSLFSFWMLLNAIWNLLIICIHSKVKDIGLNEDILSLYTGATSWWHSNGPGCLPYNISSIQPSISILQPNIITGCRLDYHLIELTQAAVHALLSFLTFLLCCCVIVNLRKYSPYLKKNNAKSEKLYRLNNLMHDRSKVNQDPSPNHVGSRFSASNSASLRRAAANKTSSRSSQHSVASMRSARRRARQSIDGTLPTPRGSTSSAQRSQKYGSLSSRRSGKRATDHRRGEVSSVTYGATGGDRGAGTSQRTRLSSLSSVDYLPSYQPPHSSSANLLSSYGEISSIDSYNNHNVGHKNSSKNHRASTSVKSIRGNTNPTYNGSRSSVCSHNTNAAAAASNNNYDDLSYIYGNNNTNNSESLYGASSSAVNNGSNRSTRQPIYQQNKSSGFTAKRNGFRLPEQQAANIPQKIHAETYQSDHHDKYVNVNGDTIAKAKMSMNNGGTFNSFTTHNHQQIVTNGHQTVMNGDSRPIEMNNNHLANHAEQIKHDKNKDQPTYGHYNPSGPFDGGRASRGLDNQMAVPASENQQQQIYSIQRTSSRHHPIYSNHLPNGNSETPI